MQSHMRHGFEDLQWIYHVLPVFEKFVMLETFGNVDILGLDIESSGLNSVILRLREVDARISVFWQLNIFNNVLYDSHDRCLENLKTQICATCTGCLHPGTGVVIAMIRRTSIESYINKTIRPTWATSCLLLSSLRGCCVALSSVTRSFQVVLVLSNAKGVLHLGIHVFLESRLATLNIWSPEPSGCVIQWFALHFMQLRQETKDFWTPIVGGFVWLWTWDDLFLRVDFIARWALCHTCANSESTLASTAVSYSFTDSLTMFNLWLGAFTSFWWIRKHIFYITLLGSPMRGQERTACF